MRLSLKPVASPRLEDRPFLCALEHVIPHRLIQEAVAAHAPVTRRTRRLPYELTMLLVIAMNIYTVDCLDVVLATLLMPVRLGPGAETVQAATKGAISQARARLGIAPMVTLFHRVCRPLATPGTPGAFLYGLRLVAIDTTTEEMPDTPANDRYFGRAHGYHGAASYPQLLLTLLVECGTHAILDAYIGRLHSSAPAAARRLLRRVGPGMLLLVDSGLSNAALVFGAQARGAHVLARIGTNPLFYPLVGLPDGSYCTWLRRAPPTRYTKKTPRMAVRIIVYRLTDLTRPGHGQTHRLLTTLLDPVAYPARDLVEAYHERWEIELVIDELETHQRPATRLLRSKTPQGVIQEVYGLLLAHYAIRATMYAAATTQGIHPNRLSFTHAIGLLRVSIPLMLTLGRRTRCRYHRILLADCLRSVLPPRALRWAPRMVKRRDARFRVRTDDYRPAVLPLPFVHAIEINPLGAALTITETA